MRNSARKAPDVPSRVPTKTSQGFVSSQLSRKYPNTIPPTIGAARFVETETASASLRLFMGRRPAHFFFGAGDAGSRPCARKIISRVSGGSLLISSNDNGRVMRCQRSGGCGLGAAFACFPPSLEFDGTSGGITALPGDGLAGSGAIAITLGLTDGVAATDGCPVAAVDCGAAVCWLQPAKAQRKNIRIRTLFMFVKLQLVMGPRGSGDYATSEVR